MMDAFRVEEDMPIESKMLTNIAILFDLRIYTEILKTISSLYWGFEVKVLEFCEDLEIC